MNNQGLVNRTKKYNITNKNWNITKQLVTCTWQRFEDMFLKISEQSGLRDSASVIYRQKLFDRLVYNKVTLTKNMCYVVYKLLSRYPSYITFRTARTSVLAYTYLLYLTQKKYFWIKPLPAHTW